MTSRITRVRIQGYRSIEDCTFEPHPELSVLVGANATGKSSVLDALQLASDLARLHDKEAFRAYHRGAIGGGERWVLLDDLIWQGRQSLEIDLWAQVEGKEFRWSFEVAPLGDSFSILREEVRDEADALLLERTVDGARIQDNSGNMRPIGSAPRRMVFGNCIDAVSYPNLHPLWRFVTGFCTLGLIPSAMREPSTPDTDLPRPDRYGRDLSGRLHALQTAGGDGVQQLLDEMTFVGWVDLRTPVRKGRVDPEILERGRGWTTKLSEASDGTLFQTYLMTLLLAPPPEATVLLVDEPALPIFPSARTRTADLLGSLSTLYQVIAVSNDEEMVNVLGNLENTWLVSRRPGSPTQLERYKDSEAVAVVGMGPAALDSAPRLDLAEE